MGKLYDAYVDVQYRLDKSSESKLASSIVADLKKFERLLKLNVTADTSAFRKELAVVEKMSKIAPVDVKVTADTSAFIKEVEGVGGLVKAQRVDIPVTADTSKFVKEITVAKNSMGGNFFGGLAKSAGIATASLGAVATAGTVAGAIFAGKLAASMEQTEIAFQGLLGSTEASQEALDKMKKFAATTPFEFNDVTVGVQKFVALGMTVDESLAALTDIGDAIASVGGSGESIGRVTLAMSQIQAKGRLAAQELNQIGEAIPSFDRGAFFDNLSVSMGKSTEELKKMAEQGLIPAKEANDALLETFREMPGAQGAMIRQSKTLNGLFSTLKDTVQFGLVDSVQNALPVLSETVASQIDSISGSIGKLGSSFGDILIGIAKVAGPIVDVVASVFGALGPSIGKIFENLAPAITALTPAITAFADVFGMIGVQISEILKDVAPVLGVFFKEIFDAIKPIIPVLGQLAKTFFSLFKPLLPIISNLFTAFAPFLKQIGGSLVKALSSVGEVLAKIFGKKETQEAITKLAEAFGQLAVVFVDALLPVLLNPAMVETFAKLTIDLLPVLTTALTLLIPVIQAFGNVMQIIANVNAFVVRTIIDIVSWIGGALKTTLDVIVGVVSNFGVVWSAVWDGVIISFNFVKDGLLGGLTFLKDSIGGFVAGIVNFFVALPGRIVAGLVNIGLTIWNGIVGGLGWVKTQFSGWIDGIVRFFYNLPGRIVGVLAGLGDKIKNVFVKAMKLIVSPINLIIKGINTVVGLLPGKQPKIGLIEFHEGGVVGETKAKPHGGKGRLSGDEMFAVLQHGETILPKSVSKNLSRKEANMLVDGRFDDFAHSISGKKGVNQKEAQNIDYKNLKVNLSMLQNEQGFGFGDIVKGVKNIGGNAIDLARLISGEVLAKSFDVAIAPLRGLLSPLGVPGDVALGLATKMRNVAVDFIKGVKAEADKQGVFKTVGETSLFNSNEIAANAAKSITPALLAKVASMQGRSGSWKTLVEYMRATGVPHVVTSTVRPGAITASGNISNHSAGRAVDFAGLRPSVDSKMLGDIFWAFMPIGKLLNELIYAGPQVQKNIKRGALVPKYAQNIHHNHVHAALHSGGSVGYVSDNRFGLKSDESLYKLQHGEFVIRRSAVNNVGVDNLEKINAGASITSNSGNVGGDTFIINGVSPEQVMSRIEAQKQLKRLRMVI